MSDNELEQRAERAVRRGELLAALELFEAHLAQQPDDDRVRTRCSSSSRSAFASRGRGRDGTAWMGAKDAACAFSDRVPAGGEPLAGAPGGSSSFSAASRSALPAGLAKARSSSSRSRRSWFSGFAATARS